MDEVRAQFYGVLGRASASDEVVALRLYPFDFSSDVDARNVLALTFERPDFTLTAVEAWRQDEVELDVFDDRVEVHAVFAGTDTVLTAGAVGFEWVGYDAEDLFGRIRQLETQERDLSDRLAQALDKNRRGEALIRELQRRAQIKAAASEALKVSQASALAVLERLTRHFESPA